MFRMEIKCASPFCLSLILIQAFADTLRWTQLPYAPLYTWLMMVEFEGRIFLRKTRKWSEETKILNKKTNQENEGNKMIIIWLSFCKQQTNKTKEKSVCPKGFLLTLTTSDFFLPVRSQQVCIESLYKLNSHTKTRFQVDELFGFYQYPVRARVGSITSRCSGKWARTHPPSLRKGSRPDPGDGGNRA